jgi:hypothetical protein
MPNHPFTPTHKPSLHLSGMGGNDTYRRQRIDKFATVLTIGHDRGWGYDPAVVAYVRQAVAEVEAAPLDQEGEIMLKYVEIY